MSNYDIDKMSDEEVRQAEASMYDTIYGEYACFGTSDIDYHVELLKEIEARDLQVIPQDD